MRRDINYIALIRQVVARVDDSPTIVLYDLETTGLLPRWNEQGSVPEPRIYEIAAIKISPDGRREEFYTLVDPGMEIPEAANIQKLDPGLPMREGRPPAEILPRFAAFIGDAVVAGHNIDRFDNIVLRHNFEMAGLIPPAQVTEGGASIDTYPLAEGVLRFCAPPGAPRPENLKLGTLGEFLGCTFDAANLHAALVDIRLNEQILTRLVERGARIVSRLDAARSAA